MNTIVKHQLAVQNQSILGSLELARKNFTYNHSSSLILLPIIRGEKWYEELKVSVKLAKQLKAHICVITELKSKADVISGNLRNSWYKDFWWVYDMKTRYRHEFGSRSLDGISFYYQFKPHKIATEVVSTIRDYRVMGIILPGGFYKEKLSDKMNDQLDELSSVITEIGQYWEVEFHGCKVYYHVGTPKSINFDDHDHPHYDPAIAV